MPFKQRRSNLLNFHRPKSHLDGSIPILKPESRQCLQTLASYTPPKPRYPYPMSRCAAVLVALFVGRMGDLYVLLNRRALTMRTYAGDTSLPGGKWETGDRNLEWTARREAFEEIGLPLDRQKVPLLCTLEPFLASNQLIVTPVVVLVLDQSIRPILNSVEVESLFSHPLISLLHTEPPFATEPEMFELKYHTHKDVEWSGNNLKGKVRMHRFLTGREAGGTKPIFGLTASVLIRVAIIGYNRDPDFEAYAPDEAPQEERIAYALKHHPVFRDALKEEGHDPDGVPDLSSLRSSSSSTKPRRPRLRLRTRL